MKADPTYVSKLKALPRVEMERLLLGSWYARQETAGYWKREWCQMVDHPNGRATHRVRCWDLAFTAESEQNKSPDWTRGVLVSKDKSSVYTVEDVASIRNRVHEVEKLIFETALRDGHEVTISIPLDPAAAAGAYAKGLQRKLAEMGFSVRLTRPVKSKITRFAPFSSVSQAGFVHIVKADWNKSFFEELEIFNGDRANKDDQVDCCSDAMVLLNKDSQLPDFTLPNFTGTNPFEGSLSGFNIPTFQSSLVS